MHVVVIMHTFGLLKALGCQWEPVSVPPQHSILNLSIKFGFSRLHVDSTLLLRTEIFLAQPEMITAWHTSICFTHNILSLSLPFHHS